MRRISIMLAKLRAHCDFWDVMDWIILCSLVIPLVWIIAISIADSAWFLFLLPIPLVALFGFLLKVECHKYAKRHFLFVDFLEDYLAMKQKYTDLKRKHDQVVEMKNTKVI